MVNGPNYSLDQDTLPTTLIPMIHLPTPPEHVFYRVPKLYKMDLGDWIMPIESLWRPRTWGLISYGT
jgi:hypothetical protein